jgi:hypothetical protein
MSQSNEEQESLYPELEMPEFDSAIPEHLLKGVTDENKFVMENISMQTQYIKWLCEAAINTNHQVRKTNGRLIKVEEWKNKLSNGWLTAAAIFTFIGTISAVAAKIYKALSTGTAISIF